MVFFPMDIALCLSCWFIAYFSVRYFWLHIMITWAQLIMEGIEHIGLRLETLLEELEIETHSTQIRVASHSHLYYYLSLFRSDDLLS